MKHFDCILLNVYTFARENSVLTSEGVSIGVLWTFGQNTLIIMKGITKIFTTVLISATLFVSAGFTPNVFGANPGDEAHAKGKAHSAVVQCIAGSQANLNVSSFAHFNNGEWTVTFYGGPNCPPNTICALYIIHLATVKLDANFKVTSTTCGYFVAL